MRKSYYERLAGELGLSPRQVQAVDSLLAGGATVPFIARYRKELTGELDEVRITSIRDRLQELAALDARRGSILGTLEELGALYPELRTALEEAPSLAVLEDLYLPYRPKRKTRAGDARARGLAPLADRLSRQEDGIDPLAEAADFVACDQGITRPEEALAGARDILAERIAEDAAIRAALRRIFERQGRIRSEVIAGAEEEAATYRDYFAWEEDIARVPGHRVLAVLRGHRQAFLKLSIRPPEECALTELERRVCTGDNACSQQVRLAARDGYRRLLAPSLETELRNTLKERASEEAIGVFAANVRELLMAPPLGRKRLLAIDPGFRTGCKVVCLDAQGGLLHHDVIYPTLSAKSVREARETLLGLVARFAIEAIAVGNGTAGRETEAFVRGLGLALPVVMVNESGASVYSASEIARQEFPDQDVTVRGAISIGRRLMDPLSELVKLDPKSIGVGQYQHDVDQARLKARLDDVVISCVNAVGVEVNTASRELLGYVSGLGPTLAANIVAFRQTEGAFRSKNDLKQVPRLGAKAFEQAAGFLRIREALNPLDKSAVHPERYALVERMARDLDCTVSDLMQDRALRERIDLSAYVCEGVGLPTLRDILSELDKPGRDPRQRFETFRFAEGIATLEDLEPGLELPGIVTNVTRFGAFVDIGVHTDGLVHISQLADRFVKDPSEVVHVSQYVCVRVLSVDLERRRISLSMRRA